MYHSGLENIFLFLAAKSKTKISCASLNSRLSELKVKCNYSNRGCQEYIRLEELDSHVENCGFAPMKCSNEECRMVVNKRDIIHHESAVCEYRKVKCHSCKKLEQLTRYGRNKREN